LVRADARDVKQLVMRVFIVMTDESPALLKVFPRKVLA